MSRTTWVILAVVILVFVGAMVFLFVPRSRSAAPSQALPAGPHPTPQTETFKGCPPEGDGGDTLLNILKNRIDEGTWQPATIEQLLELKWPLGTERRRMSGWSAADRQAVATNNGLPVVVEGYLLMVRQEGPETPNCHSTEDLDYHMWMAAQPTDDRATKSVVIEITPRVRAKRRDWSLPVMQQLARERTRVRISGWTMLDPEHSDEVKKSRGTIWEIHPVMKIETQQPGGGWRIVD